MKENDHILIRKALKGSQAAQKALYERYERIWFRLCLRYGKNRSEAQDIFQEGLMAVFRDLPQYDEKRGAFSTWSTYIMVHAALRYLKKHHWQHSFESVHDQHAQAGFQEHITGEITAKELTQIIQQLPTGYRIIFNMYEIEGYSHKEIAEVLGISVGTSKSQLAKSKKALRQRLEILF